MPTPDAAPLASRRRPRPSYHPVHVASVARLTPHMLRITFKGELSAFQSGGAAAHLKVLLPAPGQEAPVLPEWGPEGPVYKEGVPRPVTRTYTPRRFDAGSGELDIDFFLHGAGPASSWAGRAKPGDRVVVTAGRGGFVPDAGAQWHLLAGDDTALPAIGTLLEIMPAGAKVLVFAELMDAADRETFDTRAQLETVWLERGPDAARAGEKLEAALRAARLPEGRGSVWVACEAGAMRRLRRHFLAERAMERGSVYTQGYWKYGEVNHPDHDRGEDVG